MHNSRFTRRDPEKPRRLRDGLKLSASGPDVARNTIASAWSGAILGRADEVARGAGLDYAKKGQIASLEIEPGVIEAKVQGRRARPYKLRIEVDTFNEPDWNRLIDAIAKEAGHTAKFVGGGLSDEVLREAANINLPLTPRDDDPGLLSCACGEAANGVACKHAAAVAYLLAESLNDEPGLALRLRGMPEEEFIERLRMRRQLQSTQGPAETLPEIDIIERRIRPAPLEEVIDRFWEPTSELDEVNTKLAAPDVAHPLIRRLGPSPFEDCRFPLVGLLATVCDVVTQATLREQLEPISDEDQVSPPMDKNGRE